MPPEESQLEFVCGYPRLIVYLVPLSGLLSVIVSVWLAAISKQLIGFTSLALAVFTPSIVGLYAVIDGVSVMCEVIGKSSSAPASAELAQGLGAVLALFRIGVLATLSNIVVVLLVLFVRSRYSAKSA